MGRTVEHNSTVRTLPGLLLLLSLTAALSTARAEDCPLLVVADLSAPIDALSRKTIRRLYLGAPYQTGIGPLKPARNASNSVLQEVFLQKIMFMSKNAYRRVLASRLVRLSEAGPPEYRDSDELIQALYDNPRLVSYIWQSQLPADGYLKVLLEVPCENN